MAVLECLLAAMNLRLETICNLDKYSFNLRPSASICD